MSAISDSDVSWIFGVLFSIIASSYFGKIPTGLEYVIVTLLYVLMASLCIPPLKLRLESLIKRKISSFQKVGIILVSLVLAIVIDQAPANYGGSNTQVVNNVPIQEQQSQPEPTQPEEPYTESLTIINNDLTVDKPTEVSIDDGKIKKDKKEINSLLVGLKKDGFIMELHPEVNSVYVHPNGWSRLTHTERETIAKFLARYCKYYCAIGNPKNDSSGIVHIKNGYSGEEMASSSGFGVEINPKY